MIRTRHPSTPTRCSLCTGCIHDYGLIESTVDVGRIRYVRKRDRGRDQGPAIDLITKERDFTLEFRSWAKAGESRQGAERFGDLLQGFMNLPASDFPESQVRELATPAIGG